MTSKLLQQEAEKIIKELELLSLLKKHGQAQLVGSVALDLVVKLDIDIHVYTGKKDLFSVATNIINQLIKPKKVREIRISDYLYKKSLKLAIDKYPGTSGNWSIDIWLTNDKSTCAFAQTKEILNKLTDQKRKNIIKIKQHYYKQHRLRDGLSLKIYQAVLDHNIKTIQQFKKYVS